MSATASQITSVSIVYSTVYSGKFPAQKTQKMFPLDDFIMMFPREFLTREYIDEHHKRDSKFS